MSEDFKLKNVKIEKDKQHKLQTNMKRAELFMLWFEVSHFPRCP